jgi:hypothetical protein
LLHLLTSDAGTLLTSENVLSMSVVEGKTDLAGESGDVAE